MSLAFTQYPIPNPSPQPRFLPFTMKQNLARPRVCKAAADVSVAKRMLRTWASFFLSCPPKPDSLGSDQNYNSQFPERPGEGRPATVRTRLRRIAGQSRPLLLLKRFRTSFRPRRRRRRRSRRGGSRRREAVLGGKGSRGGGGGGSGDSGGGGGGRRSGGAVS